MRVLILSCNTGGGHNACAGAIQEAFSGLGYHCDIADSIHFASEKLSRFMSWGHSTMYRNIPGLFRFGYGFAEKHPAMLQDDSAIYKLLTAGSEQLSAFIEQGQYDTVICCHVFSGLLLRQMLKEYPMPLKTAFVATDYTCSPGTEKSALDLYFIPAVSLMEEYIQKGIPREKIIPIGIPVRKEFYEHSNKQEAKQKWGINSNHTYLLMMCGSMGCGPMEKLAKLLNNSMDANMELSIVCGTNEKLRGKLEEEFGHLPNVHIHGFVKDISTMMDSADLYLTKPGGISTTEATLKNLPMVLINAVAGCEAYNLRYFVRSGGAVTADRPEELCEICLELMRDEKHRTRMIVALGSLPHQNAVQCICSTMRSGKETGAE